MDILKTIPEQVVPSVQVDYNVLTVQIDVPNKKGVVTVEREGGVETYIAELADDWALVSETNQTIIRAFLKRVVEICMTVESTDITGDVL